MPDPQIPGEDACIALPHSVVQTNCQGQDFSNWGIAKPSQGNPVPEPGRGGERGRQQRDPKDSTVAGNWRAFSKNVPATSTAVLGVEVG